MISQAWVDGPFSFLLLVTAYSLIVFMRGRSHFLIMKRRGNGKNEVRMEGNHLANIFEYIFGEWRGIWLQWENGSLYFLVIHFKMNCNFFFEQKTNWIVNIELISNALFFISCSQTPYDLFDFSCLICIYGMSKRGHFWQLQWRMMLLLKGPHFFIAHS